MEQADRQRKDLKQKAFEQYCQEYPKSKNVKRYDSWLCRWKEEA